MFGNKVEEACIRHSIGLLVVRIWFRVNTAQVVRCSPTRCQELEENVRIEGYQCEVIWHYEPFDFKWLLEVRYVHN